MPNANNSPCKHDLRPEFERVSQELTVEHDGWKIAAKGVQIAFVLIAASASAMIGHALASSESLAGQSLAAGIAFSWAATAFFVARVRQIPYAERAHNRSYTAAEPSAGEYAHHEAESDR